MLSILLYPDPFLRRVAKEVTVFDGALARSVQAMLHTMRGLPHCVGIAATQVGIDQRIFVMDTSHREKSSQGLAVMVNPVIQKKEGRSYGKEGCLSLPQFLGRTGRSDKVVVSARTDRGEERVWTFAGLESVCAQHELDHLNGILFIDRLNSLRTDLHLRNRD